MSLLTEQNNCLFCILVFLVFNKILLRKLNETNNKFTFFNILLITNSLIRVKISYFVFLTKLNDFLNII